MGMELDIRLECLMEAINRNWAELEAVEKNGTLVIRVREGANGTGLAVPGQPEKKDGQAEPRAQE